MKEYTKTVSDVNSFSSLKLASIDAMRGWAIFLVMIAHTAGAIKELPWPLKKLTNLGWYGVQLFFIASAFTLLMSWHRQNGSSYWNNSAKFFIRRFFRIAPMYYLGCLLYFIIRPPLEMFNIEQLIVNLAFLNSWSPIHMTTLENTWQVVPGGWSIGVEFSFYFMFPILVLSVTTLKKGLFFFLVSLIISFFAYFYGKEYYGNIYGNNATDNFLFFWLPNQLGVFALGFVLYFFVNSNHALVKYFKQSVFRKALLLLFGMGLMVLFMSQITINKHFSGLFPWLPKHYIFSFIFLLLGIVMLEKKNYFLENPMVISLGQVSFSAYILHFSIIQIFHDSKLVESTGGVSIACFCALLILVTGLTYLFSKITYDFIEIPFINLGRKVCKKLNEQTKLV